MCAVQLGTARQAVCSKEHRYRYEIERDDHEGTESRRYLWPRVGFTRIWADDLRASIQRTLDFYPTWHTVFPLWVFFFFYFGAKTQEFLCLKCPSPLVIQHSFSTCHLLWEALLHSFTDRIRGPCSMFLEHLSVPYSLAWHSFGLFLIPPTSLRIQ